MLILDDPSTWPEHLSARLSEDEVVDVLCANKWIDEIVRHPVVRPVIEEIEAYVESVPLAAYHCTKQLAESPFAADGLRILDFDKHHAYVRDMLCKHKLVTPALFTKFDERLTYWKNNQTGRRENQLWLCVDRSLVFDHGAESFFKYFGGEAVYFAMTDDPDLGPLLERLGEPIVVEVRISSRELKVFQEFAFARTLVSHFAASVNPQFRIEGREGHLSKDIGPNDIVAVHPYAQFAKKYRPKRAE